MSKAFNQMIQTCKYLLKCVFLNMKQSVSNKKSFLIQTICMFINNSMFILFWNVLFSNKGGSINGIVMDDIMFLWSIPTIGLGLSYFCFGGVESLCSDISEGNLDIYLTKPKNSLISQLTSKSIHSAMGDLIFGLFCGIIAVKFNPLKYLLVILFGLLSCALHTLLLTSIRLSAFWLGDVSNACNKYTNSLLITLTIYPEKMFPWFIKFLMYTVIPAMYLVHIPIKLLNHFSIKWVLVLIGVTILLSLITSGLYKLGLRRYESGNGNSRR